MPESRDETAAEMPGASTRLPYGKPSASWEPPLETHASPMAGGQKVSAGDLGGDQVWPGTS